MSEQPQQIGWKVTIQGPAAADKDAPVPGRWQNRVAFLVHTAAAEANGQEICKAATGVGQCCMALSVNNFDAAMGEAAVSSVFEPGVCKDPGQASTALHIDVVKSGDGDRIRAVEPLFAPELGQ